MANTTSTQPNLPRPRQTNGGEAAEEGVASILEGKDGRTIIQNDVVAKIAGIAIREVEGVHGLAPFGAGQALTRLTRRMGGKQMRELGVHVEIGKVEAAVDARIVVTYGYSIIDTARAIRTSVKERILEMTGLNVVEVNIEVVELYFPNEEKPAEAPRVR